MKYASGVPVSGEQCAATAASTGARCRQSAFARVRVRGEMGEGQWLCRSHQARLRTEAGALELLEKWAAKVGAA